jgi:ankyrin repeat protein
MKIIVIVLNISAAALAIWFTLITVFAGLGNTTGKGSSTDEDWFRWFLIVFVVVVSIIASNLDQSKRALIWSLLPFVFGFLILVIPAPAKKHPGLHQAIETGDLAKAKELIEKGASLDERSPLSLQRPLSIAVEKNDLAMVKLLIEKKAPFQDDALLMATGKGQLELVKLLLDHGVSPDGSSHGSPLQTAIQGEHFQVVKLLVEQGARLNEQGRDLVATAALVNSIALVKFLVENKAPLIGSELYWAARHRNLELIQFLILEKAPLQGADQEFPAVFGCLEEKDAPDKTIQCLNLLLAAKANINAQDAGGNTCLHIAAYHGMKEVADFLLQHKANINAQNLELKTPLFQATMGSDGKQTDIALDLIKKGSDVNLASKNEGTAFHSAVRKQNFALIKSIIEAKGDASKLNSEGQSVLHAAADASKETTLTVLPVCADSLLNQQDNLGNTPLHYLAGNSYNTEAVIALVAKGAKKDIKNKEGKTPKDIAQGNKAPAEFLALL